MVSNQTEKQLIATQTYFGFAKIRQKRHCLKYKWNALYFTNPLWTLMQKKYHYVRHFLVGRIYVTSFYSMNFFMKMCEGHCKACNLFFLSWLLLLLLLHHQNQKPIWITFLLFICLLMIKSQKGENWLLKSIKHFQFYLKPKWSSARSYYSNRYKTLRN